MPFKLTRAERDKRDELVATLELRSAELTAAIAAYNAALVEPREAVTQALEAYNEAVNEAVELREDVVSTADDALAEKSDKWQEGERGGTALQWVEAWRNLDLDELTLEFPEELEDPDPAHRDELENAPDEAEF